MEYLGIGALILVMGYIVSNSITSTNRLKKENEELKKDKENFLIRQSNSTIIEDNLNNKIKELEINLNQQILNKEMQISDLIVENQKQKDKYKRETHLRKSSEVRLGKMAEHFMPFTDSYPYDPEKFIFLGNPIDGIQINDDEIILMEFKTGGARLSQSQKKVKDIVKEGKVYFESFRINEKGPKLTRH